MIDEAGVGGHINDAMEQGLQFLDGDAKLGIEGLAGLIIEFVVEVGDGLVARGQGAWVVGRGLAATVWVEFAAADDLHVAARGAEEGHQGVGESAYFVAEGHRLVVRGEVVDLEHHQSVVGIHHTRLPLVFELSGEAESGQVVGQVDVGLHRAVLVVGDADEGEDLPESAHLVAGLATANHLGEFFEVDPADGLLLAICPE